MLKNIKTKNPTTIFSIICFVFVFSAAFFTKINLTYAAVQFTADTTVSLTGITDGDLSVASSSQATTTSISGSTLTVSEIPDAAFFTLKTTSHNNALKITPSGGTIDLVFNSSNFSSGNITQWTLTGTTTTQAAHIVGAPLANTWYAVSIDGTLLNTYQSSASGEVSFTYTGGWSTKVFTMEADSTAPTSFSLTSPTNNSSSSNNQPTFSWNASSDPDVSYYQLYIDSSLDTNNISGTSATPSNNISCGSHTWYITAVDNASNSTNSSTFTLNILCSGTPAWLLEQMSQTNKTEQPEDATTPPEIIEETVETVEEIIDTAKEAVNEFAQKIITIAAEAAEIVKANVNALLGKLGVKRDLAKEQVSVKKYVKALIKDATSLSKENEYALNNFITYGTKTTQRLGEGERAGVINSYKSAFGKLPKTEDEWNDVIKIANGRWPFETNAQTEANATDAFRKIYLREPDRTNPNDDAAVTVIAYGLRPADRNLNSEKAAISIFKSIYDYNPPSATAWDIVRAIAYSGATR